MKTASDSQQHHHWVPPNHWLNCLVGCPDAASMQGTLLLGTDLPSAPKRKRISVRDLQRKKRI